jgi:hypothetical protein
MMYRRCTQEMCVADYGGVRESCGEDNLNMNLTSTVFVIEVYLHYHVCLNVTDLVLLMFVYMPGIMAYNACEFNSILFKFH